MTLWPRTLVARAVILLALLVAATEGASLLFLRLGQREANVARLAAFEASRVRLAAAVLDAATGSPQPFAGPAADGVRVATGPIFGPIPDRGFLGELATEIRRQLGPGTEVRLGRPPPPGLWVKAGERDLWVFLPIPRTSPTPFPWQRVVGGLAKLALATAFALWIAGRLNRPLQALTAAAARIARGERGPAVPLSGPEEIRTLAGAFNRMSAGLDRAEGERRLLLAGISHDLRAPLTRLRLAVEMLPVPPTAKARLAADVEDADAILEDLLAAFRDDGAEPPEPIDPGELLARMARRYSQGTVILADAAAPRFLARPTALLRLLGNLVDNAIRHGGGRAEVGARAEDGAVIFEVLDRGPGIPAAELEMMRQPFRRGEAARGTPGTGLGLAIAERLARVHAGTLELSRREGGGLVARVRLPLEPSATPAS